MLILIILSNYCNFRNASNNFVYSPIKQHAAASASGDKYYGTKATLNLWQPTLGSANDFSLAQLWIIGGSYEGNDLNTIEAGWHVRLRKKTR